MFAYFVSPFFAKIICLKICETENHNENISQTVRTWNS